MNNTIEVSTVSRYPCLWPEGCAASVKFKHWACGHHWHQLPPDLQARIYREFKPGQRVTRWATDGYKAAMKDLQAHLHREQLEAVS